jgi:hypothetical protein
MGTGVPFPLTKELRLSNEIAPFRCLARVLLPPHHPLEGGANVRSLVLALALLALPAVASGFSYSEGVSGDLSGNPAAPTALLAALGSNTLSATSGSGDAEYVVVTIPATYQLSSIVLTAFSPNEVAFAAVQQGSTYTAVTLPDDLDGWTHYGTRAPAPADAMVGFDLLDNMGAGAGAIGFVPPLGSGDWTFLFQQTGGTLVSYTFDFVVIPEPSTLMLVLAGLAAIASARPRHVR